MKIDESAAEKFWSRVRVGDPDECWPWTGPVSARGYGKFSFDSFFASTIRAHRMAYQLSYPNEDIIDKLICHACDNPSCCNPKHLFSGTPAENMHDSVQKGRQIGNKKPSGKFYAGELELIRRLRIVKYDNGTRKEYKFSPTMVAKMFKTSSTTIQNIWKALYYPCREGYHVRFEEV